ncbi:hypothetical protein FB107DRAFT_279367 [Schizophyllum commune]
MPESLTLRLSSECIPSGSSSSDNNIRYYCRGHDILFPDDNVRVAVLPSSGVAPVSLPLLLSSVEPALPINVVRVLLDLLGCGANGADHANPSLRDVRAANSFPVAFHLTFSPLAPSNAADLAIPSTVIQPPETVLDEDDSDVPPLEPLSIPVNHPSTVALTANARNCT